jgi:hypothetical protein
MLNIIVDRKKLPMHTTFATKTRGAEEKGFIPSAKI